MIIRKILFMKYINLIYNYFLKNKKLNFNQILFMGNVTSFAKHFQNFVNVDSASK